MNLELLFNATRISGDSTYFKMAVSHADKTLQNHFRPDASCYHVVDYDPQTGDVRRRCTAQGYSDESAWARGQAWALYGYAMAYAYTGFERYLSQAEKIAELVRSGVPQKEIAVISYKLKYFEPLLGFLKAYPEIKIAYDKRDNLFDDAKMKLIFNLSRLVNEIINGKRPSVPMVEILSAPCFKIPRMEILKLTLQAKDTRKSVLDLVLESSVPEIKVVAELISELITRGATEPVASFLDFLVERTVKPEVLESYEAFSFYENYAALVGRLKKHFGDKIIHLSDLISLLDDFEAAGMPMNVTSPYRDALDAVQVMSAHKAKGLEFEYVFIISADHTAWGKGKGNNNLLSLPKNLVQIRHTGMTDSERLRVLYVALTRAKRYLYITNSLTDFNGKSPERLEYLQEYVDSEKKLQSPLIPSGLVQCEYGPAPIEKMTRNLQDWLLPYLELSPDMHEIYRERVSKLRMSASTLTSFIDIRHDGPQAFFKNHFSMFFIYNSIFQISHFY